MKTGKELKPGTVIRIDNDPWLVQKAEFTKSGRNSAIMKTKLKNLLTGYKTETVYGADDKLDDVILDRKEATLSFISGDTYTFMDTTDYTMYELNARYGWSKFVIVVPSIAIREGVFKSFESMAEHFAGEYGKRM